MTKLSLLLTLALVLSVAPAWSQANPQAAPANQGQSWTGSIVDADCRAAHKDQACDLSATTTNYGLVTQDGKFVKFDTASNAKVHATLLAEKKTGKVNASIKGSMDGESIKVDSVEFP